MRKTSFGHMDPILNLDGKPKAEYLIFEKEGRNHQHREYESFTVLSGEGQVVSGERTFDVKTGDIVTIPPNTLHRMIPKEGHSLTGLLWYHDQPAQHFSNNLET